MRLSFFSAFNQVLSTTVLLITVFFCIGCNRTSDEVPLTPPLSHPLSRDYIGYGVVTASFERLLNEPGSEVDSGILRRGTVVRIIERRSEMNRGSLEIWVFVEGNYEGENISRGWLREAILDVFDSESRAITASRSTGYW